MKLLITNRKPVHQIIAEFYGITETGKSIISNGSVIVAHPGKCTVEVKKIKEAEEKYIDMSHLPLKKKEWDVHIKTRFKKYISKNKDKISEYVVVGDADRHTMFVLTTILLNMDVPEDKIKFCIYDRICQKNIVKALKTEAVGDHMTMVKHDALVKEMDWAFGVTTSTLLSFCEGIDGNSIRHEFGRVKGRILIDLRKKEEKKASFGYGYSATFEMVVNKLARASWVPADIYLNEDGMFVDYDYIEKMVDHTKTLGMEFTAIGNQKQVEVSPPPKPLSKNMLYSLIFKIKGVSMFDVKLALYNLYAGGYITNYKSISQEYNPVDAKNTLDMVTSVLPDSIKEQVVHLEGKDTPGRLYAIAPTAKEYKPSSSENYLQQMIYQIIYKNYLSQHMPHNRIETETTIYKSDYNEEKFVETVKRTQSHGWMSAFTSKIIEQEEKIVSGTKVSGMIRSHIEDSTLTVTFSELFSSFGNEDINVFGAIESIVDGEKPYGYMHDGCLVTSDRGKRLVELVRDAGNPLPIIEKAYKKLSDPESDAKEIRDEFYKGLTEYTKSIKSYAHKLVPGARNCSVCNAGKMIKLTSKKGNPYYKCTNSPACKNMKNPYAAIK